MENNKAQNNTNIDHNLQYRNTKVKELKKICKEKEYIDYRSLNKKELYQLIYGVEIADEIANSRKGYGGSKVKNPKSLYNLRKQAGLDKNYSKSLCDRVASGERMFTVDIYNYEEVKKLKFVDLRDILIYWNIEPQKTNNECLAQIKAKIDENELYSDAPRHWKSLYHDKIDFSDYPEWFNNITDENLKNQEIVLVWAKNLNIDLEKIKSYF